MLLGAARRSSLFTHSESGWVVPAASAQPCTEGESQNKDALLKLVARGAKGPIAGADCLAA